MPDKQQNLALPALVIREGRGGVAQVVDPVGLRGIATLEEVFQRFYFLPTKGACGVQFGVQPRPVCREEGRVSRPKLSQANFFMAGQGHFIPGDPEINVPCERTLRRWILDGPMD